MKTIMKLNVITIIGIIIIIFTHAVLASGTALGLWNNMGLPLTKLAVYIVFVHLGLAAIRTLQIFIPELRSIAQLKEYSGQNGGVLKGFLSMIKKADLVKKMRKQNFHFWMTRFTGVLFLILMFVHEAWIWAGPAQEGILKYILLAIQLLYIFAIFIHVAMNLPSLLAKIGFGKYKMLRKVLLAAFSLLMIFIGSGMIIHFLA